MNVLKQGMTTNANRQVLQQGMHFLRINDQLEFETWNRNRFPILESLFSIRIGGVGKNIKNVGKDFKKAKITKASQIRTGINNNKEVEMRHRFKFRAECVRDVIELKKILGKKAKMTETRESSDLLLGVVVEMETVETLDAIKHAMRKVSDGHVMLQTIAPKDDYTGARRYDEK